MESKKDKMNFLNEQQIKFLMLKSKLKQVAMIPESK